VAQVVDSGQERVLYRDGNDVITETRAVIGGRSIDLANIDSVSLIKPVLNPAWGWALVGVGALLAVIGYFVWDGVLLTPVFAGLALIVIGLVIAFMVRPSYTVRITDTSGAVTPLVFASRGPAANVANTLTQAVARRK